jgi:prevent-host-death family protein
MTQVIPITEARKKLLKLVDEVNDDYSRVDLTKNGRIKATLVSPDYLDSLEETIFSLHNSLADIKLAEKELAKGKSITLEEVKRKNKITPNVSR